MNSSFTRSKRFNTEEINLLKDRLQHKDLILVTGKGGVGKTTAVATMARLAAKLRGHAIAIECAAHPRLDLSLSNCANIKTVNIDIDQTVPAAVGRVLHLPKLLTSLLTNRVMRLFIRTAPAILEMILLDEVYEYVREAKGKAPVIVDLPASGHAMSLIETPKAVRKMLKVGPLAARAQMIENLLLDQSRTELAVVALPQQLPINETIELVDRAKHAGFSCNTIIVNQVPQRVLEEDDQDLVETLENANDDELKQTAQAARQELISVMQAHIEIERLRDNINLPIIELPFHLGVNASERSHHLFTEMM